MSANRWAETMLGGGPRARATAGRCTRAAALVAAALAFALCAAASRAGSIELVSGKIDTDKEPQATAQSMRAIAGADGRALMLVEFGGPIKPEWLEACRKAGAEIHQYLPNFAYLVSLPVGKLDALRAVSSVRWIGAMRSPLKIHPKVALAAGKGGNLKVTILSVDESPLKYLKAKKYAVSNSRETQMGWRDTRAELPASALDELSKVWSVFHIELQPNYKLNGERGAQTAAGNYIAGANSPTGPGYATWLGSHSLTGGSGLTVQVQDDGLDRGVATNLPGTAHLDIVGRIAGIFNATSDPLGDSRAGHGMINAGIIMGNASIGTADAAGYKLGQGLAPQARVFATKIFANDGSFDTGVNSFTALAKIAQDGGARLSSNSWGASVDGDYTSDSAEFDALTRDSDTVEAGNQQMIYFFSAGNSGPFGGTIGSPGTAKNVITVGAGENSDADGTDGCGVGPSGANSVRDVIDFSSRGPNSDGRLSPTIFSVGTHVQGPASTAVGYDGTGVCDKYWPIGQTNYARSSGTSHSCPTAAGAATVIYEFFQTQLSLIGHTANPSPAMMKAVLAATATDMYGGNDGAGGSLEHAPNNNQGWGAVNMRTLIDNKFNLFSRDQVNIFTASSQTQDILITPLDASKPLKVALAWTDAPGTPLASRELVNDLDLEVIGSATYRGNVFSNGFSTTGGVADRLNNLEMVSIANPAGLYTVRVRAYNIAGNGVPGVGGSLDQDYALFVWNGTSQTSAGVVSIDKSNVSCSDTVQVLVSDLDLQGAGSVAANLSSTLGDSEPLTLIETGAGTGVFTRNVSLAVGAAASDGALQVANGNTITATYNDANNGTGSPAVATDTAVVDCVSPTISNVVVGGVGATVANVTFTTNEPASGQVRFGNACGNLAQTAVGGSTASHSIPLSGLLPNTTYHIAVDAVDAAGNSATDDNGGTCRSFTTLDQPDYFTENFSSGDWDLTNATLTFTPDGSGDFYSACRTAASAFPTNPAGGTALGLIDDSYAQVTLAGATVALYGVTYGSFYVGSNGYITFTQGDSTYGAYLQSHFALPRISGLFDDLYPGGVGLSWKQTADRVAVTWANVSEYSSSNSNSFQIEMFFDGRIQITHLGIGAHYAISGLSRGQGVPSDFIESDLSAYGGCLSSAGTINIDQSLLQCSDTISVTVGDADLRGAGSVVVSVASSPTGDAESLTLLETGPNTGVLTGAIAVASGSPAADGIVQVASGATVTASYADANTGSGSPAVVVDTALVDCVAPAISNAAVVNVIAHQATVTFDTNEPATALVRVGVVCGGTTGTLFAGPLGLAHSIDLTGLAPSTTYFVSIEAADPAGNIAVDNNGGVCRAFTTLCDNNLIVNGSFESGDFTGWTVIPSAAPVYYPWGVTPAPGFAYFGDGIPSDGTYFAENGYDGENGATFDLYQEVAIPASAGSATLSWTERIQWDLQTYCSGCTQSRPYAVTLEPAGGGAPIGTLYSTSLVPGTIGDTGYVAHSVDILAAYPAIAGTTVRLRWSETVPEYYTGPAQLDLDNVRLDAPCQTSAGTIDLDRTSASCGDTIRVTVSDTDLRGTGTLTVNVSSQPMGDSEPLLLFETGSNSGVLTNTMALAQGTPAPDGILQIADGATILATYNDADTGSGSPAIVISSATVDCVSPVISNVSVVNLTDTSATITFDTNEPANGGVSYGISCGGPLQTVAGSSGAVSHQMVLTGLLPSTLYHFRVNVVDAAGNTAMDDNGGACHQFTTEDIPEYFTEIFTSGDNDLDYQTFTFVPNGSGSYYRACRRLNGAFPTNPAGGTVVLSQSDDSYAPVTLSGGAKISLYGIDSSTFYIGSNGYITLLSGDTEYIESLSWHFSQPRISGLFDDLLPAAGGSISWLQLPDRVAVTYQNIQQYSGGAGNNFQIEMFFDGTIRLTYLAVTSTDGLIGLSAGDGVPAGFQETNFSALPSSCYNDAGREWEHYE